MRGNKKIFVFIVVTVMIVFATTLFSATRDLMAETEDRVALIIGNSDYESSPLANPANDAADIADALKKLGFQVTLLTNANQIQMEDAIRDLGKNLRQGGLGFFFYAGHGMQVKGRNYLIPINSGIQTEKDVKYKAVDAGQVLDEMESAGNDMNIIILDACRNDPFARSFRSGNQGLARMDAPKGSLIAYSTSPGQVAADGDGHNSPYTAALLKHMNAPGQSIEKMFKEVRREVDSTSNGRQVPWESTSLTGDFYFVPMQTPAMAVAAEELNKEDTALSDRQSELDAERKRLATERERLERERKELEELKALHEEQTQLEAEQKQLDEERRKVEEEREKLASTSQANMQQPPSGMQDTPPGFETPGSENQWVEDYEFNFRVLVPGTWQTNTLVDGSDKIYVLISPDNNIVVRIRSFKVDPSVSVEAIIPIFESNILGNLVYRLTDPNPFNLNGVNGLVAGYRGTINDVEASLAVFYSIVGDNCYIVWQALPPQLYDSRVAEADAVTGTFSLLN